MYKKLCGYLFFLFICLEFGSVLAMQDVQMHSKCQCESMKVKKNRFPLSSNYPLDPVLEKPIARKMDVARLASFASCPGVTDREDTPRDKRANKDAKFKDNGENTFGTKQEKEKRKKLLEELQKKKEKMLTVSREETPIDHRQDLTVHEVRKEIIRRQGMPSRSCTDETWKDSASKRRKNGYAPNCDMHDNNRKVELVEKSIQHIVSKEVDVRTK